MANIPHLRTSLLCISALLLSFLFSSESYGQSFNSSSLQGIDLVNPTAFEFGPNGRLYVAQQDGTLFELVVERDGAAPGSGSYSVLSYSTIPLIKTGIPNHNDDGSQNLLVKRQVTGLVTAGTAAFPILYISSSDSRIGGSSSGTQTNLDTNSGVVSRLTWTGAAWDKVDLVRGLPRCEENHASNGMDTFQWAGNKYLLLQQGGNTNKGAPSNNFAGTQENFLSAATLVVNLTQLEQMELANGGPFTDSRQGSVKYIYDLPTLNDPQRIDIDNTSPLFPYPVGHPMHAATIDIGDPFGGNNGLNQAFPEPGGPVQIFAPGFRNGFDIVVTQSGRIYSSDNGSNSGWGGKPLIYAQDGTIKSDQSPSAYNPAAGEYITNDFNEAGSESTNDALHFIGQISDPFGSYFGGHPVPIRAFPSRAGVVKYEFNGSSWEETARYSWEDLLVGTSGYFNPAFDMGNFPDKGSQGRYLAGNPNGEGLRILDLVNSSTNGICEYTASNFDGAMQGNLLTASFNGKINRYILQANGEGLIAKDNAFFSGFGGTPLDIIAQGDNTIFPGTIWTTNYGSDDITVFEPADFGLCPEPSDPGFNPTADSDGDGYTNQDEIDNNTNHCSAGSKPSDFDNDLISDLNDPDDDDDGIPDVNDPFALDPDNGLATSLPVFYPFWNNDPGTGFFGLGFTGLMLDPSGNTNYLDQFEESNLSFGGAGGKATIDEVGEGDPYTSFNNQQNAFQFGIDVHTNTPPFTIHTKVESPFAGVTPVNYQSIGIYMGTGDQDNYFKMVIMDGISDTDDISGFEILLENNGSANSSKFDIPGLLQANAVDLYLAVNPAQNTVQPYYSVDSGETKVAVGPARTLPATFLNANDNQGLAVGIIATSFGPGSTFSATWDFINITQDGEGTLAANPEAVDFGTLAPNSEPALTDLVIRNQGSPFSTPITISVIDFSGADNQLFSTNTPLPLTLAPSATQPIQLVFNAGQNQGVKTATLELTHSGSNTPLLVPLTATVKDNAVRINAGGTATQFGGEEFIPDQFFTNGGSYTNPNVSLPPLYQTERYGQQNQLHYQIPLENGSYTVKLHFAEIYWGAPGGGSGGTGKRIFDMSIEGELLLDNYDIVADVGSVVPSVKTFPVTLSDGILNIDFSSMPGSGGVDQPKVSGIEILPSNVHYPPISLVQIPDQTNNVGDTASLGLSATGGNPEENFTYSISGQPEGVMIEPTNGLIFGTIAPEAADGGSNEDGLHEVLVTASKTGSAPATIAFSWQVFSDRWNDLDENEDYTGRHECSFVQAGDKFYLMGGRENAQTVDIYDYASDNWSSLNNSSPLPFNHFQATEFQGLIWVIGAFEDNLFPNEKPATHIWIFNPATLEWIQGPEIPVNRRRGSAALAVYNNKFYILGGNTLGHNGGYVNWFDQYDPATGIWTILPDAPRARDHFHAAVVNNELFAAGGRLSGGAGGTFKPLIPEVDVYDFGTASWRSLPETQNLPTPRAAAATVAYQNKLFLIGGEVQSEPVYGVNISGALAITESYDTATATWSREADLNHPRHGTQAIVSGNGIFTIAGSQNLGSGNQKNMEFYGLNQPVGAALIASRISVPANIDIEAGSNSTMELEVVDGNTAVLLTEYEITGPNAASFFLLSAPNTNTLLNPGSVHEIIIGYNGTGVNETATLEIGYGADSVVVQLTGDSQGPGFELRVNSGGPAITHNGQAYQADQFFSGGNIYTNNNAQVPQMYRTERSSNARAYGYNVPVPNGNYTVTLHFAEIYWGATGGGPAGVGRRIFDVILEGNLVLDNYDITADVGAQTPVQKVFQVTVGDGILNINLSALAAVGGVDQPKLSAFSIVQNVGSVAPVANAGSDQQITLPTNNITLNGSGNDPDGGAITAYQWSQQSGPNTAGLSNANTASLTAGNMVEGTYVFRLTVTDDESDTGFDEVAVVVNPEVASENPIANAGTDQQITLPQNSATLSGSGNDPDGGTITGYQWTQQSGPNTATLSASNTQNLTASNLVQGTYVFRLTVTDDEGATGFDDVAVVVNAASAIAIRVNSGGPAFTFNSNSWSADQSFTGGATFTRNVAIANTTNDQLYQTERYTTANTLVYNIPVTAGFYNVNLHFAEIYFGVATTGGVGSRVFNISIENNQQQINNYDIISRAGGSATAVVESFSGISVNDGNLTITLTAVNQNPKISGIEVLSNQGITSKSVVVLDEEEPAFSFVDEDKYVGTVNLAPNPASFSSEIMTSNIHSGIRYILVYDPSGRLVREVDGAKARKSPDRYELNVFDLEEGYYFVKFITEDSQHFYQSLVVKKQ